TFVSLVNVRCLNKYERNIETCLVNFSRTFIKCPNKSCNNIVRITDSSSDFVRCRCGHEFCLSCKEEPHFPALCKSYKLYMTEVYRNGDLISDFNAIIKVEGRNCLSCNKFINKNGGCNHMTCLCGAQFCWTCYGWWSEHTAPDGSFKCPKPAVDMQVETLLKEHNDALKHYYTAILHRRERFYELQNKRMEHAKRLISTIPLDTFNSDTIQKQIDKREQLSKHTQSMAQYVNTLHRICEFVAVSADGYGDSEPQFKNVLPILETLTTNITQVLEGGRGYKAIEQLKDLYDKTQKEIQKLRRAVTMRNLRMKSGYLTS
ncbi:unnamed protein product, partial [Didymodactylos carnosus]